VDWIKVADMWDRFGRLRNFELGDRSGKLEGRGKGIDDSRGADWCMLISRVQAKSRGDPRVERLSLSSEK
jgi:hypothetical protein